MIQKQYCNGAVSYNYNRSETDLKTLLISMQHGSENTSFFDLRVKMLILPQYKLKSDIGE